MYDLSLSGFLKFAKTVNPSTVIDFCAPARCPIAQYLIEQGARNVRVTPGSYFYGDTLYQHEAVVPEQLNDIVNNHHEKTFGELVQSLEAILAS